MSETRPKRVATVDVGSNTIRLLVAEVDPDGSYRLLDDEKVVARLGRGGVATGRLDPVAMDEATRAITHMKSIADGYGVERLRAVATCAVREASNRDAFVERIRETAGLDLEVIDGEEEARLAFLSVRHAFDVGGRDLAIVDIGGGSTEIILTTGGVVERIGSLPVGAVRLTEQWTARDRLPAKVLEKMRNHIRRTLKAEVGKPATAPQLMIGTGGTFTTLAAMDWLQHHPDDTSPSRIRGYELKRSDVRRWLDRLNPLSINARGQVRGLSPDRAEIIVAGLAIAETLMKRLKINRLQVHDRGIRDGLLIRMTQELYPETAVPHDRPPDRMRAVRQFAEKCRYEREHSEHVTWLALRIFDQLSESGVIAGERAHSDLLEAAGILHDIGYYIDYSRHHKHSAHLIRHADLVGFDPREVEIIANLARYHRGALPKRKHREFARLAPADQRLVRELTSILRIADGLDRAHASNVADVRVEVTPPTVCFRVQAEVAPDVDLWGAARKSEAFLRQFELDPRFAWEGLASPGTAKPPGRRRPKRTNDRERPRT